MFVLKEAKLYRLYVPFTLGGEPMAPADAMPALHANEFYNLKIPCIEDELGYSFLEIGEKSSLERKYKTLVSKGALAKNIKGYFAACTDDFLECYSDKKPVTPKWNDICRELRDSFTRSEEVTKQYDFKLLDMAGFDRPLVNSFLIAGWKLLIDGKDDPFSKYVKFVALSEESFSSSWIDRNAPTLNGINPNLTPTAVQELMIKLFPKAYTYSEMSLEDYL